MWFKNARIYRLNMADHPLNMDELADKLSARPFVPCSGLDWFSEGWTAVTKFLPDVLYQNRGRGMVALRREDKVVPGSTIREMLDAKVAEIEDKEQRTMGRKEKAALKEQLTDDLLPRALTKPSRTFAFFDAKAGWLVVDTTTAGKAESLISALRQALPPFPAALPRTVQGVGTVLTGWILEGEAPEGFELDADVVLAAPGENGSVVKAQRSDLTAEEIRNLITSQGRTVSQVGLIWRERIRFLLSADLQIRRIQFLDVLQEEASQAGDDRESLFEAIFLLNTEELIRLVDDLVSAVGGLEKSQLEPSS